MAAKLECPECRGTVEGDDFQCEFCGLLLDPEQASGEYIVTEPTIVRALLSPPQRSRTMEVPRPPPQRPAPQDLATARFTVPMDADTVPHLRAGLNIALQPLHPFEAHIASFVDGVHAVPQLALAARLPEIEVKVVLKALLERGVLELRRAPGSPPRRSRTDELPVLDGSEFLTPEAPAFDDVEPSTIQDDEVPTLTGERPAVLMALGAEEDLSPMALGDEEPFAPPAPRPTRSTTSGGAHPSAPSQPTRAMRPGVAQAPRASGFTEHVTFPGAPAPPAKEHPSAARPGPPPLPATARTGPPPATRSAPSGLGGSTRVVAPATAAPPVASRPAPAPHVTASSVPTLPASPFPPSAASPPPTLAPLAPERAPRPMRPTMPLDAPAPVSTTQTPEDFLQRAVRLERGGHVDRAIEVLTKGIDRAPEAAALHSKLALILVHQRKDYVRAARLLERAVELEPGNTVFQQNLLKVAALSAASAGQGKERKPGLFARLTGKRS
ncbi:hypothetical protein [Myxococcus sp. CA033]|nr:hypothetical protein [Myxococcus sp. CA033]